MTLIATLVTLIILAAVFLVVKKYDFSGYYIRFHRFLVKRNFTSEIDIDRESYRINFLRIVVGLLFLERTVYTFIYLIYLDPSLTQLVCAISLILGSVCLITGFIAPVSAAFIFLFNQHSDYILRTDTLGSDILQMILLVMVFMPVGTKLSIDSVLMQKSRWELVLKKIYDIFGSPSSERVSILRFLAFCSYGLLCIYSAFAHLYDPAWLEGYANTQMLTATYMGRYYDLFQNIFLTYPKLAITLSMITIYGMLFWEIFMIPLVLISNITRWFVILWGWTFLVICLIFLQLGWLAYYEVFVLWPLLFWQNWKLNLKHVQATILYDDRCNLCYRTVRFLSKVDLFEVFKFSPLSENREIIDQYKLGASQVFSDLYCIDSVENKVYSGYDLYVNMSRKVFLLLPMYPLLLMGKFLRIGPLIYSMVARNRYKYFGMCNIGAEFQLLSRNTSGVLNITANNRLLNMLVVTYVIFALLFIFRFPHVNNIQVPNVVIKTLQIPQYFDTQFYGLAPIDVFNMKDLRMSENTIVFYKVNSKGEKTLLPFNSKNGARLYWHESDHIYYGYSLPWRRNRLDYPDTCYLKETDQRLIEAVIKLDKNKFHSTAKLYEVEYYKLPLAPSKNILLGEFSIPDSQKICSVLFDSDSMKLLKITEM